MNWNNWRIDIALHERYWVFGITIGYLEEIPAYGLVINLGAGGIIIAYHI
jgi:hypothetical protein